MIGPSASCVDICSRYTSLPMTDRRLRPWDERVGADSSIAKIREGKKMFVTDTYVSQVNLPHNSPSLVRGPERRQPTIQEQVVSSEAHVWKSYHSMSSGSKSSAAALQDRFRQGVKQRILQMEASAEKLRLEQVEQRKTVAERHEAHRVAELASIRRRCAERGVEGLFKPTLRTPEPITGVPDDEVQAAIVALRKREQKRPKEEELRPFGPPIGSKTPTMSRWSDKAML